jgi:eukaryotic-like serine/threonine-protein kinase
LLAESADGQRVFVKRLKYNDREGARRRFVREVRAYETLEHPALPKLIASNVDHWRDRSRHLYLALEVVDGPTLADRVAHQGPLSIVDATAFVVMMLDTLDYCHNNDVVHRDIKPANVMLRANVAADPVLVDFGLSFNTEDPDQSDLTRPNEEVGNRFLRLPEHSTGGHNPVGDLTQVAGLLLYALTGHEPRVLVDDEGHKPHQRAVIRDALATKLSNGQYRRLQSVFDRAFDQRSAARYPTANTLRAAIMSAMSDEDPAPGLESLLAALDERIAAEDHQQATEHATVLKNFASNIEALAMKFAAERQLQCARGRGPDDYLATVPYGHVNLALVPLHATGARSLINFQLARAGDELLVKIGDDVLWRGLVIDELLEQIIIQRLASHYLSHHSP